MKRAFDILWRSLLVGGSYMAALAFSELILSERVNPQSLIWWFLGGMVIGLTLGSLACSLTASWAQHMLVWGSIIFFNITSVTIEGRFFAPELVQGSILVQLLRQLSVSLIATWLITKLFSSIGPSTPPLSANRSWLSWLWRCVVSTFSYIVFYYFFGAINYMLTTKPYYETHAGGLTVPPPEVVLMAELIRAPMIILSVVPFLLTFKASRKRLALLTGFILFALGGIAPLLMQVHTLPLFLLTTSAVEIFFQNYLTGVVAASLFGVSE